MGSDPRGTEKRAEMGPRTKYTRGADAQQILFSFFLSTVGRAFKFPNWVAAFRSGAIHRERGAGERMANLGCPEIMYTIRPGRATRPRARRG